LRHPTLENGTLFARALAAAGVSLRGTVRVGRSGAAGEVLASEKSAPLRDIVTDMLKRSDNLTAELLTKELGYRRRAPTTVGGARVVRTVARTAGVDPTIADGSGLSRFDRATVADELAWLTHTQRAVEASLPIACVDGTLRGRMCTSSTMGRVRAKTGKAHATVNLAGYTTTSSGRAVRFVFMLAGVRNVLDAQQAVDRAVGAIARARA
jgi:D-alanyl-D-alanine carboxypeptidase/D-alanyl-D-alanine-endopeptidase (penicillin-binding protein 4)